MVKTDLDKPAALTDWAYRKIKEDILSLQIAPGAQLHIETLADAMNISRTPVREALLKLEGDGLVHMVPRVGFFVAAITPRDLTELFELRELLESRATWQAAHHLEPRDLDELDRLVAEGADAVEHGELTHFLETDTAFHNFLVSHSDNRRLYELLDSIRDLTHRERMLSLRSDENVRASVREHQDIAAALRSRDAALASRRMSEHLRSASGRLVRLLDVQTPAANAAR